MEEQLDALEADMKDPKIPAGPWKLEGDDWEFSKKDKKHRRRCSECGKYWADPPLYLCLGCEAYREHRL